MTTDTPVQEPLTVADVRAALDPLLTPRAWSLGEDLHRLGGGRSALTLAGCLHRRGRPSIDVVVRAEQPADGGLGLVATTDHGALLEVARAHGVSAPMPLLAEDVDSQGRPLGILVTERIAGEVPNPWRRSGRRTIADLRRRPGFMEDFVEQMVRIHEVPVAALPAGLLGHGPDPAATYDARVAARAAEAVAAQPAVRHDPVFAHALRWAADAPTDAERHGGLVHGDYRMGNLVVRDGRLVGILDWELAEVGDTVSDVGWLHGAQARTDGLAGGLFRDSELIEAYERASGRRLDHELVERHASLGSLRTAAVWVTLCPWSDLLRGEPTAIRALLSVAQMKVTLLEATTAPAPAPVDLPDTQPSADRSSLDRGLAAFSSLLADAMGRTEADAAELLARAVRIFLSGQAQILGGDEWATYAAVVASLVERSGGRWPGADLADHLRRPEGDLGGTAKRRALELAGRPGPALADVLCGFGAAA